MDQIPSTIYIEEKDFILEVFRDPFNKRIRIDDYRGNVTSLLRKSEELAHQDKAEKLIIKGRSEHIPTLLQFGFQLEAQIDHYFRGSDAYFFSKYYDSERKKNDHWITEDGMVQSIFNLKPSAEKLHPPAKFQLTQGNESDAEKLSILYRKVFKIYPTPLQDPAYIKKTMKEGTVYYIFKDEANIISAASAEINDFYKNAELTDCATLPEYRQHGLMKFLLQKLEEELKDKNIYCAYSIARSLSFGMNAVLYQLGYIYRGRLMNNCYIYDKLENMNVWVKDLSG
ncbi:putative beta-lysine N-acetyltransferase [Neobacillus sp. PS3-34]|uniref:putative beta-lysine N-acetyltransferase n=1 Tax=Neobacillus sp. PS3-34 TaxID=3070678 RepID=UPI0027E065D7|nr:putative beta-lysine N-acetyltransferase [Neobacillus sp. PS3-34]WML47852.1 putative beta-lysine N-acetyltransferase [Neobacillus sp. PS3-34]